MDTLVELNPENWVDLFGNELFRYARNRVKDSTTAEELVQETFLAAVSSKKRFKGRSSEKTWLFSILKHKIIDHYRNQKKKLLEVQTEDWSENEEIFFNQKEQWHAKPQAWHADPHRAMEYRELIQYFYGCLAKVPRRLADVFVYRELDGLSTKEICKILNISTTNCGVMLYRARMLLRRCLDTHWSKSTPKGQPL